MRRFPFFLAISIIACFSLIFLSCGDKSSNDDDMGEPILPTEPEKHIYIAFGQSNMQGAATIRDKDKDAAGISDRFQIMNVVAGTYAGVNQTKGQWYKAVPPLIIPDSGLINYLGISIGLGPTDYFGRTLTEKLPEIVTEIGVIAVANGDLALASFHKTKGAEYFAAVSDGDGRETWTDNGVQKPRPSATERQGWTRYTSAGYASIYDAIIVNAKKAQAEGGIVKGIIVHQGESGRGLTYTTWHGMLNEIYDCLLADLGLEPDSIPILLGQTFNAGNGPEGYLSTDNRIKNVIPQARVISTAGINEGRTGTGQPDGIHFGSSDIEELGKRYARTMLEMVYNIR